MLMRHVAFDSKAERTELLADVLDVRSRRPECKREMRATNSNQTVRLQVRKHISKLDVDTVM